MNLWDLWGTRPWVLGGIYSNRHEFTAMEQALNITRKQLVTYNVHATVTPTFITCHTITITVHRVHPCPFLYMTSIMCYDCALLIWPFTCKWVNLVPLFGFCKYVYMNCLFLLSCSYVEVIVEWILQRKTLILKLNVFTSWEKMFTGTPLISYNRNINSGLERWLSG